MQTLAIALLSFLGFIVAYHTYGRWLGRKIFGLDGRHPVPSCQINDGQDYVPTRREVLFGHHFTSIAGTGPIVGPAIAIMWGWLPAVLWVVLGSIFVGAVHDFGSLVVSLRSRGQTIGDVAGRMINPRVKFLFLLILLLCLLIVVAIFGLVIATVFKLFPASVLPVWLQLPLAVGIGWWTYRRKGRLFWPAVAVLAAMYAAVVLGAYSQNVGWFAQALASMPVWAWVLVLLGYCYVASVLPVTTLLQPRDYINSLQLIVAMLLLGGGIVVAAFFGSDGQPLELVAPVYQAQPAKAPAFWPFLFITIACGAVSGFHCLVSSGTSSKQIASEADAQFVGYGSMLTEAALAILVICAVAAGIGLGSMKAFQKRQPIRFYDGQGHAYVATPGDDGRVHITGGPAEAPADAALTLAAGESLQFGGDTLAAVSDGRTLSLRLTGRMAWNTQYPSWDTGLPATVGAFVNGAGAFLQSLGIPHTIAVALIGVLVASFASTTLDTATRLQRYVVTEIAATVRVKPLTTRHGATAFAVLTAGAMAILPPPGAVRQWLQDNPGQSLAAALNAKCGAGGLVLWPLFGASNQLLAGLAFMVIAFYLLRRRRPAWFVLAPCAAMLVMPAWAMVITLQESWSKSQWHLVAVGVGILLLEAWMVVEAVLMLPRSVGRLEPQLPPLAEAVPANRPPAPPPM